jgi:hypothetical protein
LAIAIAAIAAMVACVAVVMRPRRSVRAPVPRAEVAAASTTSDDHGSGASRLAAKVPGRLAGRVTTRAGVAVRAARVCAVRSSSEPMAEPPTCVDSGTDGGYVIDGLPAGGYAVTAEAEGYFPGEPSGGEWIDVGIGEERFGLDIVLEEGGAKVAGRVLDATGGVVPGATVRAIRAAPPHQAVAVSTDGHGRFALWVRPGPVTLGAEAVGYAPARIARVAPTSDVALTLTPGSNVQGAVVSAEDGAPVPGIEVRAVPIGSWASPLHRSAVSDRDGVFSIRGLEPNGYTFVAEGDGWRGQTPVALSVGLAESIGGVRVTVSSAALVEGTVVQRADGQPCASGSVTLGPISTQATSPYDPPSAAGASSSVPDAGAPAVPFMMASIGPAGDVHFRAVPAGAYHAVVECPEHVLVAGPTTVTVGHSDLRGLAWKVDAGLGLVVHAVDEAGRPSPGARVALTWPPRGAAGVRAVMPLAVDAAGTYAVPGVLYPGRYTLAPAGGAEGDPVDVDLHDGTGKAEVTLRLRGSGSILVTVRTSSGDLVDDVRVSATRSSGPGAADASASLGQVVTGSPLGGGQFRIGPLIQGSYGVQASDSVNPPVPADGSSGGVVVHAGSDAHVTVTLERGASLRGRVVDDARQPLPDVWVSATCRLDTPQATGPSTLAASLGAGPRVVSGADGSFTLEHLATHVLCDLRAEQPYGGVGVVRDARPGEAVVVQLPAPGHLSGMAVGTNGAPATELTLSIRDDETGSSRTASVTSPGGNWRLDGVLPGHLLIFASDANGGSAQQRVVLAPGQPLDGVRLDLQVARVAQGPAGVGTAP